MTAVYTEKPESMTYMPLPDGKADVWLRQNIEEIETEDGTQWQCEEISFRTSLEESEIVENLNTIWENGGVTEEEEESSGTVCDSDEIETLRKEVNTIEIANLTMSSYISDLLKTIEKGSEAVVDFFIMMINDKKAITIDDVPDFWKASVKAALEA